MIIREALQDIPGGGQNLEGIRVTDVHIAPGSVRRRVEFILGADRLVSESDFRRPEIIVIVIDIERRLYSTLMICSNLFICSKYIKITRS